MTELPAIPIIALAAAGTSSGGSGCTLSCLGGCPGHSRLIAAVVGIKTSHKSLPVQVAAAPGVIAPSV